MEIKYYVAITVVLIILGGMLWKTMKRLRWDSKFYRELNERLLEVNHELREKINEDEKIVEELELSVLNLQNALNYKQQDEFKRHLFICNLDEGQKIVILFDEELEHSQELQQKLIDSNLRPLKYSRKLECVVFVDGKKETPLLMDNIFAGQVKATIGDINCGNFKNRGIGSFVVQNLCIILKGMGIESVNASLSTVDYHKKDKLYNFYLHKNEFHLVRELTEDRWGLVSKKLVAE